MEYLDTNNWSLIIFFSHCMLIISMLLMIINARLSSFLIMILFWITNQFITLFYGIETNQIGFILIFAFNLIILFIGLFIQVNGEKADEEI